MGWLDRLEPHTKRSYRRGLVHFAEWLDVEDALDLPDAPPVRSAERRAWEDEAVALAGQYLLAFKTAQVPNSIVQSYLDNLVYPEDGRRAYTRTTAGNRLAALRWAVREARRMGQIDWALDVDLPATKKDRSGRLKEKQGRDMEGPSKAQAKALLAAAEADEDPRAPLLMSMLRYEGYREHEIRQIDFEDVNLRKRTVALVRKKRSKPEPYPLSEPTLVALRAWLKIRGREPGPLFHGGRAGSNPDKRIGQTTIYKLVQRIGEAAGVETSPHKIRHRACTDIVQRAIQLGLPEEEILFLTGHSSRHALQPYYQASKSRKSARAVLNSLDELIEEDEDEG